MVQKAHKEMKAKRQESWKADAKGLVSLVVDVAKKSCVLLLLMDESARLCKVRFFIFLGFFNITDLAYRFASVTLIKLSVKSIN